MISVLSTTNKYILQPSVIQMHHTSLSWLSTSAFWKRELSFFQKLLEAAAFRVVSEAHKQRVDHFQSLITYYNGEVVDLIRKKLREHESHLAHSLQKENEADTRYYEEHKALMDEAESFEKSFRELKHELFSFVEEIF